MKLLLVFLLSLSFYADFADIVSDMSLVVNNCVESDCLQDETHHSDEVADDFHSAESEHCHCHQGHSHNTILVSQSVSMSQNIYFLHSVKLFTISEDVVHFSPVFLRPPIA